MVSEGVRTALETTECRPQERSLATNENPLRQKIEEIRKTMEQMQIQQQ